MFLSVLMAVAQSASATPVNQPVVETPKMICKSYDEIGSRVRKRKVCRTKAEWDLQSRSERAQGEQMRDRPENNPTRF